MSIERVGYIIVAPGISFKWRPTPTFGGKVQENAQVAELAVPLEHGHIMKYAV